MLNNLIRLIKIPSQSGEENGVANYIERKMKSLGLLVWRDDSGTKNGSNTGNIYAYLEANKGFGTLMFAAHMDTVQKIDETISPIIRGGYVTSDGKTVLGADNKAGVAVLIEIAKLVNTRSLKYNLLFFFPTREEAGIMGSSFFNFNRSKIKYVFNLDSSDTPGSFIYKSLGYINFKIIIKGLSAHAAKSYDKGIDSIKTAGALLTKLPVGKNIKKGWTLNIGTIDGGSSTNVVCDMVVMRGEMRAFDRETIVKVQKNIKRVCKTVSLKTKATIDLIIEEDSYIPPFLGSSNGKLISICKKACGETGVDFVVKESFSTSDSNFFSSKGYPVVSVSRGGENAHSFNEKIKISHLKDTVKLLMAIINLA